jgi:1-acyl-sn-glycerol-3-phosphate acyltransferase
MLRFLPGFIKGILASLSYGLNTIFWSIPIFIIAIFKFLIPLNPWQKACTWLITLFADAWVAFNSFSMNQLNDIKFHVTGDVPENINEWYLVIGNHQSWVDIISMQHIFRKRIPFLKFFLKQELIYIPFIGLAWWALDFPFMKRYSKSTLKKKPHLKGKDIEATKQACEKFKTLPISIVNFVEGTRYTEQKSKQQGQPFQQLLRPRSGGIGYVMTMLGNQIHYILDLTFHYPQKTDYWAFVTGKVSEVHIHIDSIPVTDELRGNYIEDQKFRAKFQSWLTERWRIKDQRLTSLKQPNSES